MSSEATVKAIREAVAKPKIEEGTIVRFKVRFEASIRAYSYAALFVNRQWHATGHTTSPLSDGSVIYPKMTQAGFEAVLRAPEVSELQVAVDWVSV